MPRPNAFHNINLPNAIQIYWRRRPVGRGGPAAGLVVSVTDGTGEEETGPWAKATGDR
jgi:hypothetical protein